MTRFALLPPDIQALERRRVALSRRLTFLSPNSRRGRALRLQQLALTTEIVALEIALPAPAGMVPAPPSENYVTDASQPVVQTEAFKRSYWWDEL